MRAFLLLILSLASLAAPLEVRAQTVMAESAIAAATSAFDRGNYPEVLAQTATALSIRDLPAWDLDRARLLRAKTYLALGQEVKAHGEASRALAAVAGDVEAQAIEWKTRPAAMKAYAEARRHLEAMIPPANAPIPKVVLPPPSPCASDPHDYNETGCRAVAPPNA